MTFRKNLSWRQKFGACKLYLEALYNGMCVGLTLTWTYNNERKEPITNYGLISANDCNTRHPSGWKLHGSNDGTNWVSLHTANDVYYTAFWQQKRFDYYSEKAYNRFRVTITACNNEDLPTAASCGTGTRFQIADYYLFAKRVEPDCPREGDYPPAMIGDTSYASCSEMYTGTRSKVCTETGFGEERNGCIPKAPKNVVFSETDYVFTQGVEITPITPLIVGVEVTVSIFPRLPDGLQIEEPTGTIFGTPSVVKEKKEYIITVKNKGGVTQTKINLSVVEAPTDYTPIIITSIIAVLVIIVVIVAIVMLMKKKNANKTANKTKHVKKVSSKKTNQMPVKAKKPAEVKI